MLLMHPVEMLLWLFMHVMQVFLLVCVAFDRKCVWFLVLFLHKLSGLCENVETQTLLLRQPHINSQN